jgi:hypothetical protein
MGADWYYPIAVYGYEIIIPKGVDIREYLCGLSDCPPFKIHYMLTSAHSRMEGGDPEEYAKNYGFAVLGFEVGTLTGILEQADALKEAKAKCDFEVAAEPVIHVGISQEL